MSKKTRYFKCKGDHITERRVEDSIVLTVCDECNEESKRMVSAPKCFSNTTGRSPSAK